MAQITARQEALVRFTWLGNLLKQLEILRLKDQVEFEQTEELK